MIQNLDFTFIGKNCNLRGDFIFSNDTKIAGNIIGSIVLKNKAKLTIEIGAFVEGSIQGTAIEIYGEFKGDIVSDGNVVVFPTGIVEGKIISYSLEILPGANLNITGHTNTEE